MPRGQGASIVISREGRAPGHPGRRLVAGVVVAIAGCSFVASLVLQATLYRHGSGDADEAAYILQARLLLDGRLTLDAQAAEPFFRPWLTGEHDGRLFTKYLPGWPALLALSQAVFGTMALAPALVAAGWVAGAAALARELFDDAATTVTAAVFVALSPLVLVHTALPLAYACGAATLTLATAALLRGARTGSRLALVGAGAGVGFALLIRPFDAVLVVAPALLFLGLRARRSPGMLARRSLWVAAGAAPFIAVLAAYCWYVTGSPLHLPLSASDPLDRFGFGPRRILPSEPSFLFTRRLSLEALQDTIAAAPSWVFGGVMALALAAGGLLPRRCRAERLLLLATVGAVFLGYVFWWGSAFAMPGLLNGLGPHYHLCALAPVMILAASGAARLWSWLGRRTTAAPRSALAVVAGVGLLLVTGNAVPDKVSGQRFVNDGNAFLAALLPDRYPGPSVVLVTPPARSAYTQAPYQTLRNRPDLRGPVVYAADVGAADATLPDRMPGRAIYRLRPGEIVDPGAPTSYVGSFVPLHQVTGGLIRVRATVRHPGGGTVYLRLGRETRTVPAATGPAVAGPAVTGLAATDLAATVPGAAAGTVSLADPVASVAFTVTTGPAVGPTEISTLGADLPAELVVGFAAGPDVGTGAGAWEERIPLARRVDGTLTLLTPGLGWRQVPARAAQGWLPAPVDPVLEVALTGSLAATGP